MPEGCERFSGLWRCQRDLGDFLQRMYRRRHDETVVDIGSISRGFIWECDTDLASNRSLSIYFFRKDQFVHDGES